jgi:hypothetical protein
VICAQSAPCLGDGWRAPGPASSWLEHGTVLIAGTKAERHAARERVTAYHQA